MNLSARIGQAAIAALLLSLGTGAPALALETSVVAQSPASITDKVTDNAGVLTAEQLASLEEQIRTLQTQRQELLYVVFNAGGPAPQTFAEDIVSARGANTAALVVDVEASLVGTAAGPDFRSGNADSLFESAYPFLVDRDWAGAADAAVASAVNYGSGSGAGSGAGSGSDSGSDGGGDNGGLLLGAGGVAVVATGGGIWAASRRKTKKKQLESVESARAIAPGDTQSLARQSTEVLEQLAAEELVSTDESIRRGREELDLAIAEFGPERTRQFTAAMNHSTTTLQRAFAAKQQIDAQGRSMPEAQRRQMLIDIVSSCGQADDALDAQAAEFAQMRNLLITAPDKLAELTQRTVDVRSRLPQAEQTLARLHQEYSAGMLASVADNARMATISLDEAEKSLATGRELAARPAGQQGGLVAAIRASEHAIGTADKLLQGIENAQANIATAKDGLPALIAEVDGEIAEARQIEAQGQAQGTEADWSALEELLGRAGAAVADARAGGQADPLGHYTELTNIDTELDAALDQVREITKTHADQLALFAQQVSVAASTIQAAEDLISSRRRIIGAAARTALEDAKRLHAQALQLRDHDIRGALEYARQAVLAAQTAQRRAQDDINDFNRRQQIQRAGNTAGDLITGMVIGGMLNGGGGFGGGFGGGSRGGGGGFGGSSRGGAF